MNYKICDVCYYQSEKLTRSAYRVGYKGSLKIDVCNTHQDYFADTKTAQEALVKYSKLISSPVKAGA